VLFDVAVILIIPDRSGDEDLLSWYREPVSDGGDSGGGNVGKMR